MAAPEVFVRIEDGIGRITLDRPRALNALTLDMIERIAAALDAWERDPAVRFVLLDGAGERGLCAGGDIRAMHEAVRRDDRAYQEKFFRAEYQLNGRIARFAKPYVALMDGIVMGGGVGLSAHAKHRVATERSSIGMPETGIGFLPDIGATWLLSAASARFGFHLALSGAPVGAADAIACGLADLHVPSHLLPELVASLRDCEAAGLDDRLAGFTTPPAPGMLEAGRPWIETCYAGADVSAILAALADRPEPAARAAAAVISTRSPRSLAITLRALRSAPALGGLEPCLDREFRMALACIQTHDFLEGVRAAVIDKDRKPAWRPAAPDGVTTADVDAFFAEAELRPKLWPERASA